MPVATNNARNIFLTASERSTPADRAAYLDEACAGDAALRQRVEALLRAHDEPGAFLSEAPADPATTAAHTPALVGTVIAGRYKLLEEIGDGGMGTVWMAEQREPVKRLVAVKLVKPGMDSKTVLARFEAERQALAMMDHPNIAKVLDGGATDDGRPYFVMELVKGLPLTEYCDARRLSLNDRLNLFIQICSAVQHAHQKAVIHRDLKPSNVLVTEHDGKPVPKVIDFGLAKALNAGNLLTERTLHTSYGAVVGTPLYMAPEQVGINALDVDTRTDIFALGVILYELLAGSTPLEKARFKEAAWDEVKRLIREEEPPRPSTRLSSSVSLPSLAASRQVEPAQLSRLVRGELDWIVMKSLEKDRNRRYETANGFAMDVQRYLAGEPVLAVPPSASYRVRKFVRRHKGQVIAANLVLFALLAGIAGTIFGLIRADQQRHVAERAAEAERQAKVEADSKRVEAEQAKLDAEAKRADAERQKVRAEAGEKLASERLTQVHAVEKDAEEQKHATHAAGLVQAVLNADTAQTLAIVGEMAEYRKWTDRLLREEYDKSAPNSRQKLHASIALLPVDKTQVPYLHDRLLDAEPQEVPVIRDALAPHKDELLKKLWAVLEKPAKSKEAQRLRAATALAKYDPENEKWAKASGPIVEQLVAENPVFLGLWMEGFRPIKGALLSSLTSIFRDGKRRESERSLATNILADYAADRPQVLADLLMDADDKQFAVIYAKFKDRAEQGLPLLTAVIDTKLPADLPSSDDKRETLAKRQANAAVAFLRMNQPTKVWPLLKHSPDPRLRSYLIDRLSPLGADAGAIVKQLDMESDLTIRRALVLSLGEYGETELTPDARNALLPKLQQMHRTASDPGLHAACEWLLRRWKQEAWLTKINEAWAKDKEQREKRLEDIGKVLAKEKEKTPPQWYVNTQGQTFVVIPGPVEFTMGSPLTEKDRAGSETQHQKRIGRTFALATTAVTKEQFLRFQPKYIELVCGSAGQWMMRYPEPTCPIGGFEWHEAAAYCNWLSKEEGIPEDQWCYEIRVNAVTLKAKYLSLSGYRLPTEAEMEYATRAGALTSRYYGETDELLPKYAWYFKNSQARTWPVGSLKPNDFGLFDAQGNLYTWCQERHKEYLAGKGDGAVEDQEDELVVTSADSRVVRGGSFSDPASHVRSAYRDLTVPTDRDLMLGFRLARTLPLGSFAALPPTAKGGRK